MRESQVDVLNCRRGAVRKATLNLETLGIAQTLGIRTGFSLNKRKNSIPLPYPNNVSYLGQLPEARAVVPLPALSCFIALEIIGLCPVGGALAPLPASLRAEKGEVG